MGKINKQIDEFVIRKKVDNLINKGAWNREQEQMLDYGKNAPKPKELKISSLGNVKKPANPHVLTLSSQNIKKYKKYLKPGEKSPRGEPLLRGPKGAYYYEIGGEDYQRSNRIKGYGEVTGKPHLQGRTYGEKTVSTPPNKRKRLSLEAQERAQEKHDETVLRRREMGLQ